MKNCTPVDPAKTKAKAIDLMHLKPFLRSLKAALLTALVALAWALSSTYVWANADQILGSWVTPDDKAVVEIYQQEGQYFGKFISLKDSNQTYHERRQQAAIAPRRPYKFHDQSVVDTRGHASRG